MASVGANAHAPGAVATIPDSRDAKRYKDASIVSRDTGNRMVWPSTNAQSFSRTTPNHPNLPTVKMIRPPETYVATHDTMPPQQQVIRAVPTFDVLRQLYQQTDRKTTGKRDSSAAPDGSMPAEPRPAKTPRAN